MLRWLRILADPWTLVTIAATAMVALPLLLVVGGVFLDSDGIWSHLVETVLPAYVTNSLILVAGSLALTALWGISSAWLVSTCRFPGSSILQWGLLLPMAMPTYVLAYCWTDSLEFAGPVQSTLRDIFGWQRGEYWFPEVRSIGAACIVMALALYPYVYLAARAAFLEQGRRLLESARSLGRGPWGAFFAVVLPWSRPALVAGSSLVAMEVLADFGAVDHFGIDTFTTGIYRTWQGHFNYAAATKLAALLTLGVFVILTVESLARRARRYHQEGQQSQATHPWRLGGWRGWLATSWCLLPLTCGFLLPAMRLGYLGAMGGWPQSSAVMIEAALTSLSLAGLTAVPAVALGLLLAYGARLRPSWLRRGANRFVSLGYAIPGSVVAIAVVVPFAWCDNELLSPLGSALGFDWRLPLSGTVVILIFAYLVRFQAVALGNVESGMARISLNMDRASRGLGSTRTGTLLRVHMPMLRISILTGALMVFVDVLKELPATMILRPFDLRTLAVTVHDQVSQESLALAALPALAIVLVGLVQVIILTRAIHRPRNETT